MIDAHYWFIKTFSNGDGIALTTDKNWTFELENDFFFNPVSNILVIEYFFKNELKSIKTTCENWSEIKIERIE